jgi:hypothetical protein
MGWGKSHQLGTGLGLAIGAKVGAPDKMCVNFMGDAAFGMTGLDFETAARRASRSRRSCSTTRRWRSRRTRWRFSTRSTDARSRRQLREHREGPRRLERAGDSPPEVGNAILRARKERERPCRAARIHHERGDGVLASRGAA